MPRLNPFTPEQIRSLEANRYTHHVTPNKIAFTVEFKEFFASQAALGMTTSIKELRDRIVYLEYQIEFLKKISQLRSDLEKEQTD